MVISGILAPELPVVLLSGAETDSALRGASGVASTVVDFLAAGAVPVFFADGSGSPTAQAKDAEVKLPKRRVKKNP
jgi:hypothetical protein